MQSLHQGLRRKSPKGFDRSLPIFMDYYAKAAEEAEAVLAKLHREQEPAIRMVESWQSHKFSPRPISKWQMSRDWHRFPSETVENELESNLDDGLLEHEAARRLATVGPNELPEASTVSSQNPPGTIFRPDRLSPHRRGACIWLAARMDRCGRDRGDCGPQCHLRVCPGVPAPNGPWRHSVSYRLQRRG
ncbi:MAG: cation-transporting P-type ATPase [Nitrospiraceae bacterium]